MTNLDFIKKLYNGKNCYSDHMGDDEIGLLHISSNAESIIIDMVKKGKIVFLTGNPGDGKTFLIKTIIDELNECNTYVQTDLNNIKDYSKVVKDLVGCYNSGRSAVVAANEYPFIKLCKIIKQHSEELFQDIQSARRSSITYGVSEDLVRRVSIVDLNERNLLSGKNSNIAEELLEKITSLLKSEQCYDNVINYNLKALEKDEVKAQFLSMFELAAAQCEHFAVRDILGALSFILTSGASEEYDGNKYYSAMFMKANRLLEVVSEFDPVYLSSPSIDEKLWNGEIKEGWLIEAPEKWPCDPAFDADVSGALECFKDIKRRYYFEHRDGGSLADLQPSEIKVSIDTFINFESQKKKIKEDIIKSINKIFLPSLDDKKQLHIWTTHRYDISSDAAVAVSSKAVDSSELNIYIPKPAKWLSGLEYCPTHLLLAPKGEIKPALFLDTEFLRTLDSIKNGYPVALLSPRYEQAASLFLQQLSDLGYAENNDDGEIIIASRNKSYKKTIIIQDGKYDFEEDE